MGSGVSVADLDGDGWLDVGEAGVGDEGWGTSAAWADIDRNERALFQEVHEAMAPGFKPLKVSRGSSIGDLDNDGFNDLLSAPSY